MDEAMEARKCQWSLGKLSPVHRTGKWADWEEKMRLACQVAGYEFVGIKPIPKGIKEGSGLILRETRETRDGRIRRAE